MLMYTQLYFKWITNKDLLHSSWNSVQCYVAAWKGGEFQGTGYSVYVWLNSFTSLATVTTLFVNQVYPSTK